jgi:hypothetical protein
VFWHLDVDSSHPEAEEGFKGTAVRRLKWNVSWVWNVVKQFGPYLLLLYENWKDLLLVREDQSNITYGLSVVFQKQADLLRYFNITTESINVGR